MGGLGVMPPEKPKKQGVPINKVGLSERTVFILSRAGIDTVDELLNKSKNDLREVRGMTPKYLDEIVSAVKSLNLSIYPDNDESEKVLNTPNPTTAPAPAPVIAHPESATCQSAGRITTCVLSKIECVKKVGNSVEINFLAKKTHNRENFSPTSSIEARYRVKDADGIIVLNEYWKYHGIIVGDVVRGSIKIDNVLPGYSVDFVDY